MLVHPNFKLDLFAELFTWFQGSIWEIFKSFILYYLSWSNWLLMLLVLYFILQYSLYYNKNTEKNQTCISQLEWFQKHLSIQSNISTACISLTHNLIFALHKITIFSSFNYHQKLNGIQNFIKYHFFFYNRTKSLLSNEYFLYF